MKKLLFLIVLALTAPTLSKGQSIAGTNLSYLYDPQNTLSFHWYLVNEPDSIAVFFKLELNDAVALEDIAIRWEHRESYGQRSGDVLEIKPVVLEESVDELVGKLTFAHETKPWLLAASVTNKRTEATQLFFHPIESRYPTNGYLQVAGVPYFKKYLRDSTIARPVWTDPTSSGFVFYYKTDFSAAAPAFAEKSARVDMSLKADSTFRIAKGEVVEYWQPGLYLIQTDTNSPKGFSFFVTDENYPRFTQLQQLTHPLIFICTKEEHDQLKNAGNNKREFDKVILEITRDMERAKNFMRSYFRRVELANTYFTSYKEGWKTDRGMIYLIFGPPDQVSCTDNNEVWNYKNHQVRFTFVKSGSIYDPENFVLVRDKRFTETWFYTIDLWRKSRF